MTETTQLLLKNLVFTLVVPGTAGVYLPLRIAHRPFPVLALGLQVVGGLLLLAIGAAGYLSCVWQFAMTGRGTPAPIDPPKRLVMRGLYQFVRNPIYLSALIVVVGWAVYLRSSALLIYAGVLWIVFHLFVRYVEEPSLQRRFGESYANYRRTVPRWIPARPARQS